MNSTQQHIILCSDAKLPVKYKSWPKSHVLELKYNSKLGSDNLTINLPHFIKIVNCHFPDRIKDLLEIAGYIYSADRLIKRGQKDQLEFQGWPRDLHFFIKVRDIKFWNSQKIIKSLSELLVFVSGDKNYEFTFLSGAKDIGQKNLFDDEAINFDLKDNSVVALFSGGLDSLAGALDILNNTTKKLVIISHRSSNWLVRKIQNDVATRLKDDYPDRIEYFPFQCNLKGDRSVEETQRTRIFLYLCIAFSLANNTSSKEINVFENGITSINFAKRQDLLNARASRTTHPKTLSLLGNLFSFLNKNIIIKHPYLFKTKSDIIDIINSNDKNSYLASTISCTKTFDRFKNRTNATHCGGCSQCIDRRMSMYANNLEEYDAIYDCDFSKEEIKEQESKTHLVSYLKFATDISNLDINGFLCKYSDELSDLVPYINGASEFEKIENLFTLYKRHSNQILKTIYRIRQQEDITKPKRRNTIYTVLDERLHLRNPIELFVDEICSRLSIVIPKAFQHRQPDHENNLNDIINAFIHTEDENYKREYPSIRFSFSNIIPDHIIENYDLIIEAKFVRKKDARSKITNEIAADVTKLPNKLFKLFIIYDPERRIVDEKEFSRDFVIKGNIAIHFVR